MSSTSQWGLHTDLIWVRCRLSLLESVRSSVLGWTPIKPECHVGLSQRDRDSTTNYIMWVSLTSIKWNLVKNIFRRLSKNGKTREEFSKMMVKLRGIGGSTKEERDPTSLPAWYGTLLWLSGQWYLRLVTCYYITESPLCPHYDHISLTLTNVLNPTKFRRWDDYLCYLYFVQSYHLKPTILSLETG